MDKQEASRVTEEQTKSPGAASRACAPFAAYWDAEVGRRRRLRTPENRAALAEARKAFAKAKLDVTKAQAKTASAKSGKNPLGAQARAARAEERAARLVMREARGVLRAAKLRYPPEMFRRAVQVHTPHATIAAVGSVWAAAPWPALTSIGFIVVNASVVTIGRRALVGVAEDDLSVEEQQLMDRLEPEYWRAYAKDRGLEDTITTHPEMTPGGIRCEVRLDNKWTPRTFADKADSVRALLGARTVLPMRITAASRGDWAVITIATRRATDGSSSLWTPDRIPADRLRMSLGLDIETGEEVPTKFDERLLVSGASGTGKSWLTRPLMATGHLRGDLLFIDGKGEEANVWAPVCRTAVERKEIEEAIDAAYDEMQRRRAVMRKSGVSVWGGRQLTVQVDEGQVVLAILRGAKQAARLQRLIELSSLGRSRGVVLWWATQYPVTSGGAAGVHQMIAPNLLTRISLRVASSTEAQVALDDCAHYAPQQIPAGEEWRGHCYLKGYGPRLIRSWTLDDPGVRALPASIWGASEEVPAENPAPEEPLAFPGIRPSLRLVRGGGEDAAAIQAGPVDDDQDDEFDASEYDFDDDTEFVIAPRTNRERCYDAIREGARSVQEVVTATGLHKSTVYREVKALTAATKVRRNEKTGALEVTS